MTAALVATAPRWIERAPRAASLTAGALAALALTGWVLGIPVLRSGGPGRIAMHPATALALLLASVSLWLTGVADRSAGARRVSRIAALLVAVTGLLKLSEYFFGWEFGIDRVLFGLATTAARPLRPIPPNTALCLALLGGSLATLDVRWRRVSPSPVLLVPLFLLSLLAVLGYGYGAGLLYGISTFAPMALTTAVACLALCAGSFAHRISGPFLDVLAGRSGAGPTARWLIVAAILIPAILGWLRLQGERGGYYDTPLGTALFTVGTTGLLLLLIRWHALALQRSELARTAAEQAIKDSEQLLFRILEQVPLGMFVVDAAGRPYFANRTSQEILGRGIVPGTVVTDLPEVYHAMVAGTATPYPAERQPIFIALRGERANTSDIEIHAPDRVVPIEVWAAPVYDGAGRLSHAVAAFSDISERQRARRAIDTLNHQLQQQVTELEAVNQELETFSYSVSHDLRAPLRAISGFARILLEDHGPQVPAEGHRLLGVIQDNAARMGQLIDDLLAFSRYSRQRLDRVPVDMSGMVRAVVTDLRQGATAARPAELVVATLPPAHGDPALLRQVWSNLIGNALKYSSRRDVPRVEVGALNAPAVGAPAYFVRDNGVGFDMHHATKLFGVFQRLHHQDEFEGTGVGLAIVQRIVHRHGGRVWAEAEPDRGATFFFTLPVTE